MTITKIIYVLLLQAILSLYSSSVLSQEPFFNFSKIRFIYVYTPDDLGPRAFPDPFGDEYPNSGRELYQMLLPNLMKMQEFTLPPGEQLYTLDFVSADDFRRFYIGDGWIADEASITFFGEMEWYMINEIIEDRIESTEALALDSDLLAHHYINMRKNSESPTNSDEYRSREIRSMVTAMNFLGAKEKRAQKKNQTPAPATEESTPATSAGKKTPAKTTRQSRQQDFTEVQTRQTNEPSQSIYILLIALMGVLIVLLVVLIWLLKFKR